MIDTFAIEHKDIMTVHIVEGSEGLIVLNPEWHELGSMLQMDVMQDLKADLESITRDVWVGYEIEFNSEKDKEVHEQPILTEGFRIKEWLEAQKIEQCQYALKQTHGHKKNSAKLLGMTQQSFHAYCKKHNISYET